MRNAHFRISPVELQRVTSLTIVRESNALHEMSIRLRLMAVIAIELLSIHRRNIGREMPLMVETQNIGVARVDAFQLELGMRFPKRIERSGVTLRRTRQLKDDLLRRMRMPMKIIAEHGRPFLRGRGHRRGIIVASRAFRARNQTKAS